MKRLHLLLVIQLLALTGWAGEAPFLLSVEDVFAISGRGTVVTGRVERGSVKVGQAVELVGLGKDARTVVTGIEVFRKQLDQADAGQNCGLFVRGLMRNQVVRGQVLAEPGSIQAYREFSAKIRWVPKDKGGLTKPLTSSFRPLCQFRTARVTGEPVDLPEGLEPSGESELKLRLQEPVALEKGQAFVLEMGSRKVAEGTVVGF